MSNLHGILFFLFYLCICINFKQNRKMAYVITDDCIACGTCIDECPVGAISEGDIYKIDPDACTECGTCADVCPSEAIHPA
jgi:ferredoxin